MSYLPALCFALMGPWLYETKGNADPSVGCYALLYGLACWAMLSRERLEPARPRTLEILLSAALVVFTGLSFGRPLLKDPQPGFALDCFGWLGAAAFLLSIALLAFLRGCGEPGGRSSFRLVAGAALGALLASSVLVPMVSPRPFIDVWVNNQSAVDHFLHGLDPYAQAYPDIYQGRYGYAPGFLYFPGILYWLAPFRALFGDIRYGLVLANALTALSLHLLARRLRLSEPLRWLLPLVWLAFPVTSFVLAQAWIDPLLLCLALLSLWCSEERRWASAGLLAGGAFAMKQYGFLIPLFVLLRIWTSAGPRPALRAAAAGAAAFSALVLPFVVWDAGAFVRSTVLSQTGAAVRLDAFNLTYFLYRETGGVPPAALRVLISAAAGLGSAWFMLRKRRPRLSDAAAALAASYGAAFLFGKWAFCNYHHLLAGFVLAFVLSSAEREEPRSIQASRRGPGVPGVP